MDEPKRIAVVLNSWNRDLIVSNGSACFEHNKEWIQVGDTFTLGEGGERDVVILHFFSKAPSNLRIENAQIKKAILEAMAGGRVV